MRLLNLAALALAATSGPSIDVEATLDKVDANYARLKADKFADTLPLSIEGGESFVVTVPVLDGQVRRIGGGTVGYFTYEAGRLSVYFFETSAQLGPGPSPGYSVAVIRLNVRSAGQYRGSNAFGAAAIVEKYRVDQRSLAVLAGAPSQAQRFAPIFSQEMLGSEAREITKNLKLRITGRIARLPSGEFGRCANALISPKIDNPLEIMIHNCWLGVQIDRIEVIDGTTGAILEGVTAWANPTARSGLL